jgi:hypothetical protein
MGVPAQATRSVLFVVRLSDGRVWKISPRRGAFYVRLLAVTQAEILVGVWRRAHRARGFIWRP